MPLPDYKSDITPILDATGYNYYLTEVSSQHAVKSSGGILGGVMVNTTLVSAVRLYDNTVSGAPVIATIPGAVAGGTFYHFRTRFNAGLVVSTGGGADRVTLLYL